jgi:meiotically up-regulated gene 157 (Mug157) protein
MLERDREIKEEYSERQAVHSAGNCLFNTVDTTLHHVHCDSKLDTLVLRGDIEAMRLRDSTTRMWP